MFERFTDRARRVVVLAQEEARLLNHNYIGTEHILLGLIHEGEGVAAKALESLGISLEAVRAQVEEIIGHGGQAPSGHIPFTPRAKRALELSTTAIILVHNHPSGDPTPSRADIDMTKLIVETAKPLGIAVHDHIIIGKDGHVSLKGLRLF